MPMPMPSWSKQGRSLLIVAGVLLAACVEGEPRTFVNGQPIGADVGDGSPGADKGPAAVEDKGSLPVEDEGVAPGEDEGAIRDAVTGTDTGETGGEDLPSGDEGPADSGRTDAGGDDGGEAQERWRHACDGDDDCAQGSCRPVPEGGNRACVAKPARWTHDCDYVEPGFDHECCGDEECPGEGDLPGFCVAFEVDYCGGPAPMPRNICRIEGCLGDATCGDGKACAPAGYLSLPWSRCVDAACAADGDCSARAGGECRPLLGGGFCAGLLGFYCTYADDPCRTDADCPGHRRCVPAGTEAGGTACVDPGPPPP